MITLQNITAIINRKKTAATFLDKWAGKFSITEKKTDDARYNYLLEKYK